MRTYQGRQRAGRAAPGSSWAWAWSGLGSLTLPPLLLWRGYIHPDEWHQSVEVAATLLTGRGQHARLPWEFTTAGAARSVLVPVLASGPPVALWHSLRLSPTALALLLRLYSALTAGLVCRAAVRRAAEATGLSSQAAVTAWSLSWPAVVLVTRPLSNTLEAVALAVTMLLALGDWSLLQMLCLGCTLGVAVFCRFTALLFLAPLIAWALAQSHRTGSLRSSILSLATGIIAASCGCIAADSRFFGTLTLTPLNSLLYNSRSSNLAEHGLHPRLLHFAVNLPLLALPLLPSAMGAAAQAAKRLRVATRGFSRASRGRGARADTLVLVLASTVVLPIAVLSLAPHQEPRFLLPVLLPLAALGGPGAMQHRRHLLIGFNVALALFFGGMHQAGVLPAVTAAAQHAQHLSTACALAPRPQVLFWRTYLVPQSLFRAPAGGAALPVVDLGAVGDQQLDAALARMPCSDAPCATRLLVLPGWRDPPGGALPLGKPLFPHFSAEDAVEVAAAVMGRRVTLRRALSLVVYSWPCASSGGT
jgi:phosphatidylinositol glycan class Z